MIRRLVALAAVVVVLAACGGDDGGSTGPTTYDNGDDAAGAEILIEFDGGEPVRDIWRQDVDLGDRVSVVVTGDRDEQVHVHGYDLYVEPDQAETTLEFDALIPGRFEIEMEQSGRLLLEITVS